MLTTVLVSSLLALTSVYAQSCELWEFSSPQCGACRQMEPVVAQLKEQGWPVRKIDVNQEPELAQQVGVQALPSFLVVADGKIVAREVGLQSRRDLTLMLERAKQRGASLQPTNQRPNHLTQSDTPAATPSAIPTRGRHNAQDNPVLGFETIIDAALRSTVRLRIEDESGISFGTGTIVDVHHDEVLVLTCAHIFSASKGSGKIRCDLFVPGAGTDLPGKLISHDIRRDVGLVSLRTQLPMQPVRVGGIGIRPSASNAVFSIGCNRGADPTVQTSKILAVNRYHGPANLVVGGRPIDGRSGGGLFTMDGALIGVCNAADQQADEGLYAALGPIHSEFDSAGLGFVYRREQPAIASRAPFDSELRRTQTSSTRVQADSADPARPSPHGSLPANNTDPSAASKSSFLSAAPSTVTTASAGNTEVICIVRSPDGREFGSKVYVLDRPSPTLMRQLSAELDRRGPHALTQSRALRERPATPNAPRGDGGWRTAR